MNRADLRDISSILVRAMHAWAECDEAQQPPDDALVLSLARESFTLVEKVVGAMRRDLVDALVRDAQVQLHAIERAMVSVSDPDSVHPLVELAGDARDVLTRAERDVAEYRSEYPR